jgi:nitrogen fixation protein NifU and related proteins
MSDEMDDLEELLMGEARKNYSDKVVDYAMNPRNLGVMENPGVYASITGPCGDTMEIWVKIKDDVITEASFMTDGCGTSIASGGMVTELAKGRNIREALAISQQDVLDALDGLPEENRHCALLATNTMKAAIRDYVDMKKEPWEKAYKKR